MAANNMKDSYRYIPGPRSRLPRDFDPVSGRSRNFGMIAVLAIMALVLLAAYMAVKPH
jgi:hypothetical protein